MSDTHACWPWTSPSRLAAIVDQVNALAPDLILHAGDFILPDWPPWWRAATPDEAVAPFRKLSAPLGVYAVLGNHDWRDDPEARQNGHQSTSVAVAVAGAGLTLLDNEARQIRHGDRDFTLVGTGSRQGPGKARRPKRKDDLTKALATAPDDRPRLLLAHEPDQVLDSQGHVDLQLSGHCHSGQLDLWGWRPLTPSVLPGRHAYGLTRYGETPLVVSAGIGFSGLPLRIGAPPEITLITLQPSEAQHT